MQKHEKPYKNRGFWQNDAQTSSHAHPKLRQGIEKNFHEKTA